MAPGTTRTMTAVIPPGRYRLGCIYSENATVYSADVTVSGPPVDDAHPYARVTYNEMAPVVNHVPRRRGRRPGRPGHRHRPPAEPGRCRPAPAGQGGLAGGPPRLRPAGRGLRHLRRLQRRDRRAPERPSAGGERSGLDRIPPAGVRPVAEPAGGHRGRGSPTSWTPSSTSWWPPSPSRPPPPNDLSLRTHEILENTLQFEFTGEDDQGSHTGLATAMANVAGHRDDPRGHRPADPPAGPRRSWPPPTTDLQRLAGLGRLLPAARRDVDAGAVPHPGPARAARRDHRPVPRDGVPDSRPPRAPARRRRAHDPPPAPARGPGRPGSRPSGTRGRRARSAGGDSCGPGRRPWPAPRPLPAWWRRPPGRAAAARAAELAEFHGPHQSIVYVAAHPCRRCSSPST